MYTILIEKRPAKFLSKLDSKSYRILSNAVKKLSLYGELTNLDIKPLKGKFKGMARLRVGSRRVLFTIDEMQKEIKIWIIENRGDVY